MFYVISMSLDTKFIKFVVIQMTVFLHEIVCLWLGCYNDFAALMNLHEIQMPVMWQIECLVSLYIAVHNARIVDNLGKLILTSSLACT